MGNVLVFRQNAHMNVDVISYITTLTLPIIENILKDFLASNNNSISTDYHANWKQLEKLLNENNIIQSGNNRCNPF